MNNYKLIHKFQCFIKLLEMVQSGGFLKPDPSSGLMLTSNEIKDVVKVSTSLETRRNLLKGTTRKISSQKGGFLNFLRLLMSFGLPFMNDVLTPLAKSVLVPLGLTAAASARERFLDQAWQH